MSSTIVSKIRLSADGKTVVSGEARPATFSDVVTNLISSDEVIVGNLKYVQTALVAVAGMSGEAFMRTGSLKPKFIGGF